MDAGDGEDLEGATTAAETADWVSNPKTIASARIFLIMVNVLFKKFRN